MRKVNVSTVRAKVEELALKANISLRPDVKEELKRGFLKEKNVKAKKVLDILLENAALASKKRIALCQDTGLPTVFVELGQDVVLEGGNISTAVKRGIESAYRKGSFRNSVVKDPLKRGRSSFGPPVISYEIVPGRRIRIQVLPKGFGCENKARVSMLIPTAGIEAIRRFVVETVEHAGPDACPPYVIGVGIGGTLDKAAYMAKKALLRDIRKSNRDSDIALLERDLFAEINKLGIGPSGMGGRNTVLGVNVLTYPTHIAGLPVAVNISCHVLRSAGGVI